MNPDDPLDQHPLDQHPLDQHPLDQHPLDQHPLDNVIWHALQGRQAALADPRSTALAARFSHDVAWFAAMPDTSAEAWAALADLLAPDEVAIVFRDHIPPVPTPLVELSRTRAHQMIADQAPAPAAFAVDSTDAAVVELDDTHIPAMMALIDVTKPGPFLPGTVRVGRYFGIERDGELIAMAGQRMQTDAFCEISAVCTHPAHRGHGYGALLTQHIVRVIADEGRAAFLHVVPSNTTAIDLYRRIGFRSRRLVDVVGLQIAPAS